MWNIAERELDMQKRVGGGGNQIQPVFNNKRDIFSVLIKRN